jgi:hypothetical protein
MAENPVSRVRDRFAPSRRFIDALAGTSATGTDILGRVALRDEVSIGDGVVGRPGVPHGNRRMEQIARVHRRTRQVAANGVEQLLVPAPSDRGRGGGIDVGVRAGRRRNDARGHADEADRIALRRPLRVMQRHPGIQIIGEHVATDGPDAALRIGPDRMQRLHGLLR